jgi:hypothetical protein
MSFYLIFSWLACVLWAILGFWVSEWFEFISFGIFGSGALLCFARAYVYLTLNDFEYLQDVNKLNKKIDRHNKDIDDMEIKKSEIQRQFADGTLVLPKLPVAPKPVVAVKPQPARPQPV